MPKLIDCIYCKGKGFNYTNLMHKSKCKECEGTGQTEVNEKRKSILVPPAVHRQLKRQAHEHQRSLVDFITFLSNKSDELEL